MKTNSDLRGISLYFQLVYVLNLLTFLNSVLFLSFNFLFRTQHQSIIAQSQDHNYKKKSNKLLSIVLRHPVRIPESRRE
jgi:hypothetical protein